MTTDALLEEFISDIRSHPHPDVVEYLEQNIEFSSRVSPNQPGRFSTLLRPYMRKPLRDYHPESGCSDSTLCWGSQCAKTTVAMGGLAYTLHNNPRNCLYVMPTEALGRSWSQTRFHPLVDDNPVLAQHKPGNSDQFKALEMLFDRMTMNVVGSNSPANLASRPAALVICDEVCKFARASSEESSAMKLAEQRTKTFPSALRAKMSTPTTPENEFWIDFLASDQSYYYIPCPNCREHFVFEHSRETLVWSPDAKTADGLWDLGKVKESAHYACPFCQFPIKDHHKPGMLLAGDWKATNPSAPASHHGYHLNSFYSPDLQCSFGNMAVRFLQSLNLFGLQDYYNGWLALPWSDMAVNVKEESILALRNNEYRFGTIPDFLFSKLAYLTLCADPGQNETHWIIAAVCTDGEIAVVDCGTCLAPEDLVGIMKVKTFMAPNGKELRCRIGLVDSGDFTTRIYDLCHRSGGLLWPSKGSPASFGAWSETALKTHPGLNLYTYVDYTAKLALYVEKVQKRLPPLLHLPADAPAELIHGMSGQQLLEQRTPRGTTKYWKKIRDDHYGDCVKLAMVTYWVLQNK